MINNWQAIRQIEGAYNKGKQGYQRQTNLQKLNQKPSLPLHRQETLVVSPWIQPLLSPRQLRRK